MESLLFLVSNNKSARQHYKSCDVSLLSSTHVTLLINLSGKNLGLISERVPNEMLLAFPSATITTPASHTSTLMAFISQHCRTPAQLLRLLDVNVDISLYFEKDWDNLNGEVTGFLFAAAEHTKAPPVGLQDSDTILKNTTNYPNHYTLVKCFGAKNRRFKDFEISSPSFNFHVMIK